MTWTAGCYMEDDYKAAIKEVVSTQELNTRTKKEKTYHLIVSFRPEDRDKLTPEDFKAIERRFAEKLGLSEHQRHCGVHINTQNMHMHVAYNLIDKERFTRIEPWRDYVVRDKLCRELEKEYGLTPDNGRETTRERGAEKPLSQIAATVEAHSGEKTFESYAREHAADIIEEAADVKSWKELHEVLARHGMTIEKKAGGLAIRERDGKTTIKASSLSRDFSLKKLEGRLGKFEAVKAEERAKLPEAESSYQPEPIQKLEGENRFESYAREQVQAISKEIAEARNWQELHELFGSRGLEIKKRGAGLVIKNRHGGQHVKASTISRDLSLKKLESRLGKFETPKEKSMPDSKSRYGTPPEVLARKALWTEWKAVQGANKENIERIRAEWKAYKQKIERGTLARKNKMYILQIAREKERLALEKARGEQPRNWLQFLQARAHAGDERALAVLRSRTEEIGPEQLPDATRRQAAIEEKIRVLENKDLSAQMKKKLVGRAIIESMANVKNTEISTHGNLIYTMEDGSTVCDTGNAVSYSKNGRDLALKYMQKKWGIRMLQNKGQTVLVFPDGQRVVESGQGTVTRPKPIPRHLQRESELAR